MKLLLERIARKDGYTIGRLYIDGTYFCDTLEDTDRGLTSDMSLEEIRKKKLHGVTAIPTGTYRVTLSVQSRKYLGKEQYQFCHAYLPRLISVPGYEGVLIHIGNYPKDTDGCILVGRNTVKGAVMNSTQTFKELYEKLQTYTGSIWITIR